MPLIPQQKLVSYRSGIAQDAPALIKGLMKELERERPCRIVAMSILRGSGAHGVELIAVVEFV